MQLQAVFFALLFDILRFPAQPFGLDPGALHLLALLLQLGQYIFKILVGLADQIVCFLQNVLAEPQFTGNSEGIGLAGNADQQLVGRPQGLHIKFAGGIDHALRAHGIEFQFRIVGGCHHAAAHFATEFDNGSGQGCAFSRVRTGTQLVKQHQSPVIALLHHIHNGAHMAGEGGQTLGDGLLVTDIRQDGIKGRKLTAISRRNMQAAFSHQRQQTHGF